MEQQFIFIDVDGTLIGRDHQIRPSSIEAIQKARSLGHKVFICTGRPPAYIFDEVKEIGFDGYVQCAGAIVEVDQHIIFQESIPEVLTKKVIGVLKSHHCGYHLETQEKIFIDERSQYLLLNCHDENNVHNSEMARHQEMAQRELPISQYKNEVVYKISSESSSLEALLQVQEILKGDIDVVIFNHGYEHSALYNADLSYRAINKVKGIQAILAYYHHDIEHTIAFGDGMNDIEMLDFCHIGIAMGNGHPALISMADDVVHRSEEDGIYEGFKKYHLLGV